MMLPLDPDVVDRLQEILETESAGVQLTDRVR